MEFKYVGVIKAEGIENLKSDFLEPHFFMIIIGKPGCGKTAMIKELILNEKCYFQAFDNVFFITPSDVDELEMCDETRSKTLDMDWVYDKLSTVQDGSNVLFVFDDMISQINMNKDPRLYEFIFNRRHLIKGGVVSLILTSQKYTMIPAKIRPQISSLVIFKSAPTEIKKVREECWHGSSLVFNDLISQAFASMYSFVYLRLSDNTFYINFEKKYGFV